jgi:3-phenylpropionate/trans-cinnamate dioxygenase ferredoxin reductase component
MTDSRSFAIVGASLAGAKAAETLRSEGFGGKIVLIGEEPVRPYERPPLSKHYLRGEELRQEHQLFVHDEGYYEGHDIDLRLSTQATSMNLVEHTVELGSGERIVYDALLLTTGASTRHLRIPGADLEGVYYLRSLTDAENLQKAIRQAQRVVVIGAGWIGCEVAASVRQMGTDVAMVETAELPLERVLGAELGRFYRDVHADAGVELHLGVGVMELRGGARVEQVVLADGTVLDADAVAVGVGVIPRAELAQAAGLKVDNGILTDAHLATDTPGIFAAGDVANAWHPLLGQHLRLEHWSSALNQGPAAARNMLGISTVYERVPFFFSDQYDVGMEYAGYASGSDQVVLRGEPSSRKFMAFWLCDSVLAAGMHVNTWGAIDPIQALIAAKCPLDPAVLANPDVDLTSLVPAA